MANIQINVKGVVHKLLNNIKPHMETGPDDIPSCIVKTAADQFALFLTELYQASLGTGEVP